MSWNLTSFNFILNLTFVYSLHDIQEVNAYVGNYACLKAKTNQQKYIKIGIWELGG